MLFLLIGLGIFVEFLFSERLNFTMPPSMSYGELIGMSTQDVGDIRRWSREELEWVRQNTDAGNSLLVHSQDLIFSRSNLFSYVL